MGAGHAVAHQVPAERNSFVGRRTELAEVRRLLSSCRLVTLVGPGGVGKTRLALRAAADLRRMFPDGTFTVDLTAVYSAGLVAQQVASAMHVRDPSGQRVLDHVAQVIADRRVLLLLDNCEHVRDSTATVVHALLSACPHLAVLSTSRLPLDVDGESLLVVPPLSLAQPGTAYRGEDCEAVQLLKERARAAAPTWHPTSDAGAPLLAICRRLDGLPLAIELAAVRLRTLSPEEIVVRLDDRFRLLRRSGVTIPERHRTLLATMQWSHDLLEEPERVLWRRASVFADSFDVTAAEAVCTDDTLPPSSMLDALVKLVDASIVEVSTADGNSSRFRMLDSVRAFGQDLLTAAGEQPAVRERHRMWCSAMTATATLQFLGPAQVAAFDRIALHHHEISAALDFCVSTPGQESAGLSIAIDLWLYWEARGRLTEGRRRLDTLLAACPEHPRRARALAVAGYLALAGTESALAVPLLSEAKLLALAVGDVPVVAMATQYLGQAALFDGDLDRADALLREAADLHLPLDERLSAFCWADIGVVALVQGRLDTALAAFTRSLAQNANGNPWSRSHALWGLGLVQLGNHDSQAAYHLEQESLVIMQAVDDSSGSALCVGSLACVAAERDQWEHAARLSGAERMLWQSIPAQIPAPVVALHHDYEEATRQALGQRRWATCFDEGSRLDRAAAIALALGEPSPDQAAPQPSTVTLASPLTARQLEVADLVTAGMTDRQIAARLVISPRTAESHVENILTRLGLRNRAEIAAWTARRSS